MDLIDTFFNPTILVRAMPLLLSGLTTTILLGLASIALGMALGLVVCILRLYAPFPSGSPPPPSSTPFAPCRCWWC
jgi:polar amino acid transport system permease protein